MWKMSILNLSFYKGGRIRKTKVCDVVCVWVRDALVLVSARHSEWVQPPPCLPPSASRHISEESGAFFFPRQVPSWLPPACLGREGRVRFPPAPWPWEKRGKFVPEPQGVPAKGEHKNEYCILYYIQYSNIQ